jgi:hypothetical protein
LAQSIVLARSEMLDDLNPKKQTSRYAWASVEEVVRVLQGLGGDTSDSVLCMEIAGAHGLDKRYGSQAASSKRRAYVPATGERQMENPRSGVRSMTHFWKGGETYHIIQAMKATGNRPGVIAQWKETVAAWAQMNRTDPDAAAVNAWLPLWQVRPFIRLTNWRRCGRRSGLQRGSRTNGRACLNRRSGWSTNWIFTDCPGYRRTQILCGSTITPLAGC